MLNLVDVQPESKVEVSVDNYIPLTITSVGNGMDPKLYWRATPNPRTMLELGIDKRTGRWCSLTLTAIPSDSVKVVEGQSNLTGLSRVGTPVFSVTPWGGAADYAARFLDYEVAVELKIRGDSCEVLLGEEREPFRAVRVGSVAFLLDEQDMLVRVQVLDLTTSDREALLAFA
jgi:hypothetical protein